MKKVFFCCLVALGLAFSQLPGPSPVVSGGVGGGGGTGTVTGVLGTANEITSDGDPGTPTLSIASTFRITGKTATAPVKADTTLPSVCTVGDMFFDTDATAGQNLFGCTALDVFTLLGGGGGGAGAGNHEEFFVSQTSVSITAAEHGFNHAALVAVCYDNANPKQQIFPVTATVNPSTFELIATFSPAQSGSCVVNGSGGGGSALAILNNSVSVETNTTSINLAPGSFTTWGASTSSGAVTITPDVNVATLKAGLAGVNVQTGTSYTVLASDAHKLVTFSNASPVPVTLPQATGSFTAGWFAWFQNSGAGTVTMTPTTSTIDGAASLALTTNQGVIIFSDGANYHTSRGMGGAGGSGTVTGVLGTANEIASDGNSVTPTLSIADTFRITGKTATAPVKTGTTAPATCTVGDLFFDTDASAGQNSFGCTATNTWTEQGGGGSAWKEIYRESFIGGRAAFGITALGADSGWSVNGSEGGFASARQSIQGHPGTTRISSPTTLNALGFAYPGDSPDGIMGSMNGWAWRLRITAKLVETTDTDVIVGFVSAVAGDPPADGMYWRVNTASSANWFGTSRAASTDSTEGTGQAANANWHVFEIRNNGSDSLTFFIDDVQVGSAVTTNIPTANMNIVIRPKTLSSGNARQIDVDAVTLEIPE